MDWHTASNHEMRAGPNLRGDSLDDRLVATSHLLEWLQLLPVEQQPPPEAFRRAARWLCAALAESYMGKNTADFCPATHAVSAVQGLIGEVSE
jgi:hypothetical protein